MDKLKPCPFCGGKPDRFFTDNIEGKQVYLIACTNLDYKARTGFFKRKADAEKMWNKRVGD